MTTMYRDIESGEIVTNKQLLNEFNALKALFPDEYNYTFEWYAHNCLAAFGGTLERIR